MATLDTPTENSVTFEDIRREQQEMFGSAMVVEAKGAYGAKPEDIDDLDSLVRNLGNWGSVLPHAVTPYNYGAHLYGADGEEEDSLAEEAEEVDDGAYDDGSQPNGGAATAGIDAELRDRKLDAELKSIKLSCSRIRDTITELNENYQEINEKCAALDDSVAVLVAEQKLIRRDIGNLHTQIAQVMSALTPDNLGAMLGIALSRSFATEADNNANNAPCTTCSKSEVNYSSDAPRDSLANSLGVSPARETANPSMAAGSGAGADTPKAAAPHDATGDALLQPHTALEAWFAPTTGIPFQCPVLTCRARNCTYEEFQTRGPDEPSNVLVTCRTCKHQWKAG